MLRKWKKCAIFKFGKFSYFSATLKNDKTNQKKKFAIKHLVPTTHPVRIEKELSCLLKIGGTQNVVGVDICFRHSYSVAIVMPYQVHDKFHEYFDKLRPAETQLYMKNLLIALRHVHSFKVIHRDIKPSNFLYNRATQRFLLVDFGLAQELTKKVEAKAEATGSEETTSRKRKLEDSETAGTINDAKRVKNMPATSKVENLENKEAAPTKSTAVFKTPLKQSNLTLNSRYSTPPLLQNIKSTLLGISVNMKMTSPYPERRNQEVEVRCFCYGKSQVCNLCIVKREIQASRAGTPGYRAVEVLLKYPDQDCAVDCWSAGVIFLSLLSRCYPFFKSHDDFEALAEIITLLGDSRVKKTALQLGRHLKLGRKKHPLCLRKLCQRLRNRDQNPVVASTSRKLTNCDNCFSSECICKKSVQFDTNDDDEYTNHAYDLLTKLLEPTPSARITASAALEHPFFSESFETKL
jgi:cell division control protein 7